MVPPSWNNFLRPLLRFVVVRSNHGERLVRISLFSELMSISLGLDKLGSVFLLHRWLKEEEERSKKEEKDCTRSRFQPTAMLVTVLWALVLSLLAECMPVWPSI